MKLSDSREHYYTATGSLSTVARQLAFAGIAVIWIFVQKQGTQYIIPQSLLWPLYLFVLGLAFDLLQYVYASAAWGIFSRSKELSVGPETKFKAPPYINWPTNVFFWLKSSALILAYGALLLEIVP
ncbi:hypothetical protein [Vibrio fluvialis]|uniref:hypothetical protein n=1 Tax=Vibrio fluvialis TaxID=676 RepID=UPI0029ACFD4E|nr:hypothetical protein [Vibrio fluvialis]